MAEFRAETKAEFAQVRAEAAEFRAETKAEFSKVRAEMADMNAETKAEIAGVKTEVAGIYRHLWLMGTGLLAAMVALRVFA